MNCPKTGARCESSGCGPGSCLLIHSQPWPQMTTTHQPIAVPACWDYIACQMHKCRELGCATMRRRDAAPSRQSEEGK